MEEGGGFSPPQAGVPSRTTAIAAALIELPFRLIVANYSFPPLNLRGDFIMRRRLCRASRCHEVLCRGNDQHGGQRVIGAVRASLGTSVLVVAILHRHFRNSQDSVIAAHS